MHTMRRMDRQLSEKEALDVLQSAEYGVLSTVGPEGEPYGIPLTFAVEPDASAPTGVNLVFHAATAGRKLINLDAHPEVHFTAIVATHVVPEEFSIEYQSIMLHGQIERIKDRSEKISILLRITEKYSAEFHEEAVSYAERAVDKTVVLRLRVAELTGKQLKRAESSKKTTPTS